MRSVPTCSESVRHTDFGTGGPNVWVSLSIVPTSCRVCEVVYIGVRAVIVEGGTEAWDPHTAPKIMLTTRGVLGERGEFVRTVPEAIGAARQDLLPLVALPGIELGRGEYAYAADWLVGRVECTTPDPKVFRCRLTEVKGPIVICVSISLDQRRISTPAGAYLQVSEPEESDAEALCAIRDSGLLSLVGIDPPAEPLTLGEVDGLQRVAEKYQQTTWGDELLLGMYQAACLGEETENGLVYLKKLQAELWPSPIRAFAFLEESRQLSRAGRWDDLRKTIERGKAIDWSLFPAWRSELDQLQTSIR